MQNMQMAYMFFMFYMDKKRYTCRLQQESMIQYLPQNKREADYGK